MRDDRTVGLVVLSPEDLARFLDTSLLKALSTPFGDPATAARLALDDALHLCRRALAPRPPWPAA